VVRGFLVDGKTDKAVALMKTANIYLLKDAVNPPEITFVNGSGKPIDTIFTDNYTYFEGLAKLVEEEQVDAVPPSECFAASERREVRKRQNLHLHAQCRRLGGHLLRPRRAAGQREELDPYHSGQSLVSMDTLL
jgi:hypothetical protein